MTRFVILCLLAMSCNDGAITTDKFECSMPIYRVESSGWICLNPDQAWNIGDSAVCHWSCACPTDDGFPDPDGEWGPSQLNVEMWQDGQGRWRGTPTRWTPCEGE